HFALLEPDGLAFGSRQDRLVRPLGEAHADDLVSLLEGDRDDAGGPGRGVGHQVGLLDEATARREHYVTILLELAYGQERRELLLGLQTQQVGDAAAARG